MQPVAFLVTCIGVLGCVWLCPLGGGVEHKWWQLALQAGTPVGNLHLAPI